AGYRPQAATGRARRGRCPQISSAGRGSPDRPSVADLLLRGAAEGRAGEVERIEVPPLAELRGVDPVEVRLDAPDGYLQLHRELVDGGGGVQPTVRAPVVLPEVLTEAARAAPVDRGRVGVDAELQARPVQVGAPAIEVGGDLVIELRPVGVVVDGHVHGHAGRPPRLAVDPDADRGVVVAAAGPFLPVGFLRTAVLVAGDHREAVGTEIVDLAAPQGLARHPLRA